MVKKAESAKSGQKNVNKRQQKEKKIDHLVLRNRLPNGFQSGSEDFAIEIEVATANGFEPLITPPKGVF